MTIPTPEPAPNESCCRDAQAPASHECCPGKRLLRLLGGVTLAVLLAMLLNDPLMPGPVSLWALLATVLVLGKSAYIGVRWLTWHSAVRFTDEETYPTPLDWLAKLVTWVGFGVALTAAILGVLALIFVSRTEPGRGVHLLFVLKSLVPTTAACLVLLPLAYKRIGASTAFTKRDRGVLPVTAAFLFFALMVTWWLSPPGHGTFVAFMLRVLLGAFLPTALPHHIIGVAVACAVLRTWLGWTGGDGAVSTCGCAAPKGDEDKKG